MIRSARLLTAFVTLLFVAACGLKGPLYLPDESKDEVAAPASEESDTQSQKKDRALGEPSVSPPDPDRPAEPQPDR
jgi:predicted small lipoprotein YifL